MNDKVGIIRALRDMVPLRPLTHIESLRVAERQAIELLRLTGVTEPPVPETIVSRLPRIKVERVPLGGSQGAAQWWQGRWLILINGTESWGRQRFSLFHEFKHILDSRFENLLYRDTPDTDREDWIESVICERFAADVLMPRMWVKRAFAQQRIQSLKQLARLFDVSLQAMRIRLEQLDFITPNRARCNYAHTRLEDRNRKEDQHDYLTAARRAA